MFVHTVLSVCLDSTHSFSLYPSYFFCLFPTCNQVIMCQNRAQFWHVMAYLLGSLIILPSLSFYPSPSIPLSYSSVLSLSLPLPPPHFFAPSPPPPPPPSLSLTHTHLHTVTTKCPHIQYMNHAHTQIDWIQELTCAEMRSHMHWHTQKCIHKMRAHKYKHTNASTNTYIHMHTVHRPIHARFMKSAWKKIVSYIEGILPKGPYLSCVSMADRALLAGYHRHVYTSLHWKQRQMFYCM